MGHVLHVPTLLTRDLLEVFDENDAKRRRATIDEIFTEDCLFHEPNGVYRGRDEIDRVAGKIKATHPDFCYQPIAAPEELGNIGRIQWVSGFNYHLSRSFHVQEPVAADLSIALPFGHEDRAPFTPSGHSQRDKSVQTALHPRIRHNHGPSGTLIEPLRGGADQLK